MILIDFRIHFNDFFVKLFVVFAVNSEYCRGSLEFLAKKQYRGQWMENYHEKTTRFKGAGILAKLIE
jgi:hypothetical protein